MLEESNLSRYSVAALRVCVCVSVRVRVRVRAGAWSGWPPRPPPLPRCSSHPIKSLAVVSLLPVLRVGPVLCPCSPQLQTDTISSHPPGFCHHGGRELDLPAHAVLPLTVVLVSSRSAPPPHSSTHALPLSMMPWCSCVPASAAQIGVPWAGVPICGAKGASGVAKPSLRLISEIKTRQ